MKMKVLDIEGIALDWAVGKADNRPVIIGWSKQQKVPLLDEGYLYTIYSPSSDWSQGGPIIEREKINSYQLSQGLWESSPSFGMSDEFIQYGPTPLIAAMRCYVASKLGEEVDVPDELIKGE